MSAALFVPTRSQLAVLEAVNSGEEYAGNWGDQRAAARECADKRLLIAQPAGHLPPWRLTVRGRRVLRESVERDGS
jgi:hypothetical protein